MSKYTYRIDNIQQLRDFLTKLSKLDNWPLEITVDDAPSNKRSNEQNRLQRKWINELEQQGDMRSEDYRAYCKLHLGVPILRNTSDEFKARYDSVVRHLPYETKIELMKIPFDFPVTRIMNKKQKSQYLDAVYQYWTSKGFALTRPSDLMYANEANA